METLERHPTALIKNENPLGPVPRACGLSQARSLQQRVLTGPGGPAAPSPGKAGMPITHRETAALSSWSHSARAEQSSADGRDLLPQGVSHSEERPGAVGMPGGDGAWTSGANFL